MAWKGKKPTEFIFDIEKTTTKHIQDIAIDAIQQLVTSSPVDQGTYRYSHMFSTDSVDSGTRQGNGDTLGANMPKIVSFRIGQIAYISNSLPYAERIENGWSQQAPSGVYSIAYNYIRTKYGG